MIQLEQFLELKIKLDQIDQNVKQEVFDGFYQSRLRVILGMWEKGEAVVEFRGVNSSSFYEVERQTGRQRHHLKEWYNLYKKHLNFHSSGKGTMKRKDLPSGLHKKESR